MRICGRAPGRKDLTCIHVSVLYMCMLTPLIHPCVCALAQQLLLAHVLGLAMGLAGARQGGSVMKYARAFVQIAYCKSVFQK